MITIKQFNNENSLWDSFVQKANNGTLFHTRKFLGYHPKERFTDHSLIFTKKGKLMGVFPASEIIKDGKRILVSHPGASMGSLVVPENLAFANALNLVGELVSYTKKNGFDGIRLTQPPSIYSRHLSNYVDFALLKHGFIYQKRDVSSVLFLEKTIDENLRKFKSTHRRAVRKAEKSGIMVKQSDDFETFYEILKQNLSIRHNVSPTHTLDELNYLKKIFPKEIQLFGAFLNNQMVAGVVNFSVSKNVILAFYISHNEKYQESRPINLLFYKIFEWAIEENYSVFDFGIFTVNEEPNMGLARFKENFGAGGQFRDTLELRF